MIGASIDATPLTYMADLHAVARSVLLESLRTRLYFFIVFIHLYSIALRQKSMLSLESVQWITIQTCSLDFERPFKNSSTDFQQNEFMRSKNMFFDVNCTIILTMNHKRSTDVKQHNLSWVVKH